MMYNIIKYPVGHFEILEIKVNNTSIMLCEMPHCAAFIQILLLVSLLNISLKKK